MNEQNCRARRQGQHRWVTRRGPRRRSHACPWLIRRFVDRVRCVLFVAAFGSRGRRRAFKVETFDIENVFWSHGRACTRRHDRGVGLSTRLMMRLATMVRRRRTGRLDQSPEAPDAGGIARLVRMYDGRSRTARCRHAAVRRIYRWCRGIGETHNWPDTRQSVMDLSARTRG